MYNSTATRELGESTNVLSKARRISWGAIFAGVAIALSIQLLLNLLGLGIGASTIDVRQGDTPGSGLATGAGVWFAVSALLSLFAGSWAAGRLAGVPNREDGMLHGFTTWSVTTIATICLLSSAVGGLIGGSASLLGKVGALSAHGANSIAPGVTDLVSQATGITPTDVKQQAGDLVSDPRFQTFVSQSVSQGNVTPEARQNLVALVSQKQNVSPDQANQEISGWQQRLEQAKEQTRTTAANAADSAASGVAKAGLWSFLALLLGAIAASIGGAIGAPVVKRSLVPTTSERPVREMHIDEPRVEEPRSEKPRVEEVRNTASRY